MLGVIAIAGVGVYAVAPPSSQDVGTATFGHTSSEVTFVTSSIPKTALQACAANKVLKMNSAGTAWECLDDVAGGGITGAQVPSYETDPTVKSWAKTGGPIYGSELDVENHAGANIVTIRIKLSRTSTLPSCGSSSDIGKVVAHDENSKTTQIKVCVLVRQSIYEWHTIS